MTPTQRTIRELKKETKLASTKDHPNTKHGHCRRTGKSRTYRIWRNMHTRCKNRNSDRYAFYGKKGISVCERWNKFENFLSDMGEASVGMEIERLDYSGDYEPANCAWKTRQQQMRNTSRNRLLAYNGKTKCLTEWAELIGIDVGTIWMRLKRGWSTKRALETSIRTDRRHCG